MMNSLQFKALSALLSYPQAELLEALPEISTALADMSGLSPLFNYLTTHDLIAVQENYVASFDRNPSHSLHLFEHIHGEDRARGQAMVDLIDEFRSHGFEPCASELPDYLPLVLEFLSQVAADEAAHILGEAVHVIAHVGNKLRAGHSPYAPIFRLLEAASPITAEPLLEPPVRDMDEALETFGPGKDGVEPLLRPTVAPINFYPSARR